MHYWSVCVGCILAVDARHGLTPSPLSPVVVYERGPMLTRRDPHTNLTLRPAFMHSGALPTCDFLEHMRRLAPEAGATHPPDDSGVINTSMSHGTIRKESPRTPLTATLPCTQIPFTRRLGGLDSMDPIGPQRGNQSQNRGVGGDSKSMTTFMRHAKACLVISVNQTWQQPFDAALGF